MDLDVDRVIALEKRRPALEAMARRMGCSAEDARDCASEAIARTIANLHKIDRSRDYAYAWTTAHNLAVDLLKRARLAVPVDPEHSDSSVSALTRAMRNEARTRFFAVHDAVMATLPERWRQAIVLTRRGMSSFQVAKLLETNAATVRSWLGRARKKFSRSLGDPPPGVDWLLASKEDTDDD